MGNYFTHNIMCSFKDFSNGGMLSTVWTTMKRKQHFLTCLHNDLSPYAWRGEAPPILKRKGKGENEGNIPDLKITCLENYSFNWNTLVKSVQIILCGWNISL
jgi:hypothetical protein